MLKNAVSRHGTNARSTGHYAARLRRPSRSTNGTTPTRVLSDHRVRGLGHVGPFLGDEVHRAVIGTRSDAGVWVFAGVGMRHRMTPSSVGAGDARLRGWWGVNTQSD
jgi:hypothetical protein